MSGSEKRWYERVRDAARNDPAGGLEICELGLAENPRSHGLHFLAGYIHARLGHPHAAVSSLARACEIDANHLPTWRELAGAQVAVAEATRDHREQAKAWMSAAESLTHIIDVNPLDARALLDRARSLGHIKARETRAMSCVDALCALSTGTLDPDAEDDANRLASASVFESKADRAELSRQLVGRVRGLATDKPLAGARLAREAARVCDATFGMFAGVLFADVGEIDQALEELGASLEAVGSNLNPLNVVAEANVPVANPAAVANVWDIVRSKQYSAD